VVATLATRLDTVYPVDAPCATDIEELAP